MAVTPATESTRACLASRCPSNSLIFIIKAPFGGCRDLGTKGLGEGMRPRSQVSNADGRVWFLAQACARHAAHKFAQCNNEVFDVDQSANCDQVVGLCAASPDCSTLSPRGHPVRMASFSQHAKCRRCSIRANGSTKIVNFSGLRLLSQGPDR